MPGMDLVGSRSMPGLWYESFGMVLEIIKHAERTVPKELCHRYGMNLERTAKAPEFGAVHPNLTEKKERVKGFTG